MVESGLGTAENGLDPQVMALEMSELTLKVFLSLPEAKPSSGQKELQSMTIENLTKINRKSLQCEEIKLVLI